MLTVLIADDDPVSRRLLQALLKKLGHESIVFNEGLAAWERLKAAQDIDVAILDWAMPGMEGPEICDRHSHSPEARFCYRIILSGQMEREQIFQALHRGAHDVLEKPCDLPLLQSRLEVARKIIEEKRVMEQMAASMEQYAHHMEQLAQERAQQLVHADRMSSLGTMASGIAHEINNPMSMISGNIQNLARFWTDLEPLLRSACQPTHPEFNKIDFILNETPQIFEGVMKGVHRVTKIVNSLRKYSGKTQKDENLPFDLNECITQAVDLCKGVVGSETKIHLALDENMPALCGDTLQIEQVLVNLIINATHAVESSQKKEIKITTAVESGQVAILVDDSGCGISPQILGKIWDPFMTTKGIGKGTGLGLSISSGIIKAHGGTIDASNREEGGARFRLMLPLGEQQ